jgi:photosystem II stability/assembly factor-like uncharacterized protein
MKSRIRFRMAAAWVVLLSPFAAAQCHLELIGSDTALHVHYYAAGVLESGEIFVSGEIANSTMGFLSRSTDLGNHWEIIRMDEEYHASFIHFETAQQGEKYAWNGGHAVTTDGGATWTPTNTGIPYPVRSLAAGKNGERLMITDSGIALRSTDYGDTWEVVLNDRSLALRCCACSGNLLACGAATGGYGLLLSFDGGRTWMRRKTGSSSVLAISLIDETRLLYCSSSGIVDYSIGVSSSTIRFSSIGRSFRSLDRAVRPGAVVAGGDDHGYYALSTDTGRTWTMCFTGYPETTSSVLMTEDGCLLVLDNIHVWRDCTVLAAEAPAAPADWSPAVFPNPVRACGLLSMPLPSVPANVYITNVAGSVLRSFRIREATPLFSIPADFTPGMYFAVVVTRQTTRTAAFLVY